MSAPGLIITDSAWKTKYIGRLRAIHDATAEKMRAYLSSHMIVTLQDWNALIDFAYGLTTGYGEMAAAIACEFYDAMAVAEKRNLQPAQPAEPPDIHEVAKAVRGAAKTGNNEVIAGAVQRLVKRTGVDTTLRNAIRDGAQIAWIPVGDSCPFCIMLASNGWQNASKKTVRSGALEHGHAKHVHANCDCTYAVRFDSSTNVEGYDPNVYRDAYDNADGRTWREKLNAMRSGGGK